MEKKAETVKLQKQLSDGSELEVILKMRPSENRCEMSEEVMGQEIQDFFGSLLINIAAKMCGPGLFNT